MSQKLNTNTYYMEIFITIQKMYSTYVTSTTMLLFLVGLVGRVFDNGPGDLGSIPGRVIRKTLEMVLDTSLLNTQPYKVRIKGKTEQSRERSSALPYTSV